MPEETRLEAYHFYEQDWDDYDDLLAAFEWEVPDSFNMATYVCDRWAEEKSRVALFADDGDGGQETYTYWQLRNAANSLANHLADCGVSRGDRVGINASQRPETVISHIACWKLGAVSVPLSTLFGTDAVSYRLDDASAVACIVESSNVETVREVRDDVSSLETVLTVDVEDPESEETDLWTAIEGASRDFETVETDAEDDAIIIYTSGTTGDPKGVRHAHRLLLGNLPLVITGFCNMELQDSDVFWTPSEWAWVATLFDVVFPALFYGRPLVAYTADEKFDPEAAMSIIERYGVTNYFAPPTALRMMVQIEEPDRWDVSSMRVIPSGGESLGQSIVDWAEDVFDGAAVHEAYGQTEANMIAGDCTKLVESREGKIGKRAPGHEIEIVDPDTAEATVERGTVGEIAVRYEGNPVCFKEYWNKPEKTDGKVQNGWLLTEDLGRMDEDGYVEFVSRKDTVIISAGYRIGPVEIEEALATHDVVADAGVIGIPDDERGEVPKAFITLASGHEASTELKSDLRQYVRDRLAEYEYPREIEFVDELPTTSSGKVRRASLEEREGVLE
jgi:acetyl-CoA synthetase